jgi:thioredoxin reductase (NADPH)
MPAPVLLAVEDDPVALCDVERQLTDRYASNYRVVCTNSPDDALGTLTRLADSADEVALVLAAQWLPGTTGSELLARAAAATSARQAGTAAVLGGVGTPGNGRRDLRLDGPRNDRLLRAEAGDGAR